ncbi:MAG: HAD family hydrolase [Gemmatimonadetes bacterium]|nr:HAD family hydrolase [Gemmatimonadota bacterium]
MGAAPAPDVLVLFDIDGTLLTAGQAPRRALEEALVAVYGTPGPVTTHDFSGKTDPQIILELLEQEGLARSRVRDDLERALDAYVERLGPYLAEDPHARLLPGIAELVPALAREPRAAMGLLTGNVARGARAKLARFGLWEHFDVGAFGSDDADRNLLPAVAVARAAARWGVSFPPSRTFVIGDTPLDIAAGRVIGAVTVAVDTGRTSGRLAEHAPDHLFDDLGEWAATLWPVLFGAGPAG